LKNFNFLIYSCPNMSIFFTINFKWIRIFESVQFLFDFVFCFEKLSQFQIIPKHVNIFKFNFFYYNFFFFKQHKHCITFTCLKGLMNFLKPLNLINVELIYENMNFFKMCLMIPCYYKKMKIKEIVLWKLKGPLWK
jgi:hypothetical protein